MGQAYVLIFGRDPRPLYTHLPKPVARRVTAKGVSRSPCVPLLDRAMPIPLPTLTCILHSALSLIAVCD